MTYYLNMSGWKKDYFDCLASFARVLGQKFKSTHVATMCILSISITCRLRIISNDYQQIDTKNAFFERIHPLVADVSQIQFFLFRSKRQIEPNNRTNRSKRNFLCTAATRLNPNAINDLWSQTISYLSIEWAIPIFKYDRMQWKFPEKSLSFSVLDADYYCNLSTEVTKEAAASNHVSRMRVEVSLSCELSPETLAEKNDGDFGVTRYIVALTPRSRPYTD